MAIRRATELGFGNLRFGKWLGGVAALALAVPALADVKDGVDAWTRGDHAAAVAQWRGPADAGDADAQFNLGQAYRLGLGVTADPARAEYYYARAAEQGHVRAADTYGLILFQSGRTEAALPFIQDAARRGDPRSQYLLGIAHFNGDVVPKDWVRAYALLTLANSQSLPQAGPAIAQMDQHIPLTQRQQAASLAVQMEQEAEVARASDLAAFDLAAGGVPAVPTGDPVVVVASPAPTPAYASRVPQPIATTPVPASSAPPVSPTADDRLAAARDAVRQAMEATGTEDPGESGADFARPATAPRPPAQVAAATPAPAPARPAPAATPAPRSTPAPTAAAAPPRATPAPTPSASGPWKVQLGAFGVSGNAEKLWQRLSSRPELAGKKRLLVPSGNLTRLLAGGFATRAEADAACNKLKQAGQTCLVTQ